MKIIFPLLTALIFAHFTYAQSFINAYGQTSQLTYKDLSYRGGVSFGDFNNDNHLDLVIMDYGSSSTKVYKNNGQGYLQPIPGSFPSASSINARTDVKWVDFDNDGFLDLIFFDCTGSFVKIYKNQGTGMNPFVLVYSSSRSGHGMGNADFNRDGKQDYFLLNPQTSPYYFEGNWLYMNSGTDSIHFKLDSASVNNTTQYSCQYWNSYPFDYNKDGYTDLHIKYYNNTGAAYLTGQKNSPRLAFNDYFSNWSYNEAAATAPVDLNGNGNYNLIIKDGNNTTKIWEFQNDSANVVSTLNLSPQNVQVVFDYNNDGKIDLIHSNSLYSGNGNYGFSYDTTIYFSQAYAHFVVADIDNDHDLDFYAQGSGSLGTIYENQCNTPNNAPSVPTNLYATMDSTHIYFHWDAATDTETPQASLTYNVMVGTNSKGIDVTSPHSDTITGFRRVVEPGNAFMNTFYVLEKQHFNLGDTLYFSVQTIDNGFAYSAFSKECKVVIVKQLNAPTYDTICSNDTLSWYGYLLTTSGQYQQILGANNDSIEVIHLQVNPSYQLLSSIHLCAGQSYNWNGQNLYTNGTYYAQHTTQQGCDSVESIVLTISPTYTTLLSEYLCWGDSLEFANSWLKTAGTYIDSSNSQYGCDSIVKLSLKMSPFDTLVYQSNDTLFVNSSTANIQWYDCVNGNPIFGATQQVFVPPYNGIFHVQLYENGCTWESNCFTVMSIHDDQKTQVNIAPNPATEFIQIHATSRLDKIELYTASGMLIKQIDVNDMYIKLSLEGISSGVYHLKVYTAMKVWNTTIVKQ